MTTITLRLSVDAVARLERLASLWECTTSETVAKLLDGKRPLNAPPPVPVDPHAVTEPSPRGAPDATLKVSVEVDEARLGQLLRMAGLLGVSQGEALAMLLRERPA